MKKLLLIITITLIIIMPTSIYATAGGGSTGGGNSGSSGGGTSHIYHNRHNSSLDSYQDWAIQMGIYGAMGLLVGNGYAIIRLSKARKRHNSAKKIIKTFESNDDAWQIKKLKKRVREVFKKTQQAWSNQDCEAFKPYLTDDLYENWCGQIEWQQFKNVHNVVYNIHLFNICFIDILDEVDNSKDYFCVYIQALMIDYMEDSYGNADKSRLPGMLYEYWYFKRIGDEFYLDRIDGVDEVEL